jgi:hypothetical protein
MAGARPGRGSAWWAIRRWWSHSGFRRLQGSGGLGGGRGSRSRSPARPPGGGDGRQRPVRRSLRNAELRGSLPSVTSRTHQRYAESGLSGDGSVSVAVVSAVVSA